MHPLIAKVTSVKWIDGKRRDDHSLDVVTAAAQVLADKPTLTFITTPNNPTGTVVRISEIIELAKVAASVGGLLVVDEAYAEFSSETSAATLIAQYPNVIVIRTMSKAFAFAGARLGYLVADPAVIDALQLVRLPYHLSAITQAVAEVALSFSAELLAGVDTLITQRELVQAELTNLGLTITPSSANFLLFGGFNQPADQIWQKLLDRGILIRDVGLLGQLRVTIGTAAENQAFLAALAEVLSEGENK
jgi:histidinol-phosphate aminotransferase